MNALAYAAAAPGNHDFNYGLDILERAYAAARFPVVCCNIRRADGGSWLPPWAVIECALADEAGATRPFKVGVIGFAPPQIAQWDEPLVAEILTTLDIVDAARAEIGALRSKGVDLVVALCHSGISRLSPQPGEENAALDLAKVDGIDALFLGHQHLLFPGEDFAGVEGLDAARGTIDGKPAVMAGFLGQPSRRHRHRAGAGTRPAGESPARESKSGRSPNATKRARPSRWSNLTRRCSRPRGRRIGRRSTMCAPRSEGLRRRCIAIWRSSATILRCNSSMKPSARLRRRSRRRAPSSPDCRSSRLALRSNAADAERPDFYTDVAPGPIAIKDVADIYPYPNSLRVLKLTGTTLSEWLERSASIFRRLAKGSIDEQPLLGPAYACYNFDVIDGVEYAIDVVEPARYDELGALIAPDARRIRDLKFNGAALDPNQVFLVVTNSYRASGGGGFPGCDGRSVAIEAPDANRDVVLRHIASAGKIAPRSDGNWRFAPWPAQIVATYLTSPAAAALPAPPGLRLTSMGSRGRRLSETPGRDDLTENQSPALSGPGAASADRRAAGKRPAARGATRKATGRRKRRCRRGARPDP